MIRPDAPAPSFIDRGFGGLLARPRMLGFLLVLLSVLAFWQAAGLRVAVDLSGLVDPRGAAVQGLRDYQARFGQSTAAGEVFLLRAPSWASERALETLEDQLIDLNFAPGVAEVVSLFSVPAPGAASPWITGADMLSLPPALRLAQLRAASPIAAQLLSPDLTGMLVAVRPEPGAAETGSWVAALTPGDQSYSVAPVGLAEVNRAIGAALLDDLRLLVPLAILLCLGLTAAVLRSWRAALACALPPVVGVLWFFGVLAALNVPVDPLIGALPVVLIVLCFSDCVHLQHAVRAMDRRAVAQPLRRALVETFPAAALTTLTTMLAFASLTLTGAPALVRMGLAGVLGMALCLMAWALLAPLLMRGSPATAPGSAAGARSFLAPARRLAGYGRWVALGAGGLMLGLLILQMQSQAGFRYAEYLPRNAPVTQALQDMEALGLGSDQLFVVVESLPERAEGGNALAVARLLWGNGDHSALLQRLSAADGTAHALPVQLPILARDAPADRALMALEAQLAAAGLGEVTQLVGPGYALLSEGPRQIDQMRWGFYATLLSITVLIGFAFRSWRLALLALVPNLVPILGVEAFLVLAGRELTIMNMIALTVAFGIAVDDTLHLFNRYRLATAASRVSRVSQALVEAGPPMLATSAILLGGMAVTLFSVLPGVALFGLLLMLAVVLALLADLYLLPGLIRWGKA